MIDMVRVVRTSSDHLPAGEVQRQLKHLGEGVSASEVRPDLDIFCPHTRRTHDHRTAFAEASAEGASALIVLEANCLLIADAAERLGAIMTALSDVDWTVLHLGLMAPLSTLTEDAGSSVIAPIDQGVGAFANLYSAPAIEQLLKDLPADPARLGDHVNQLWPHDPACVSYASEDDRGPLEATIAKLDNRFVARPMIATTPWLLPYQEPASREQFGLLNADTA